MFDILNKYHEGKGKNYKEKSVSEKTLIKLFIKDGKTESDAKFHTNICKTMGSSVLIGNCKYTIKK
jgi:hypothetical protein